MLHLYYFDNNMVFAMVIKLVLEWWASKLGIIKTIIGSELNTKISLMLDKGSRMMGIQVGYNKNYHRKWIGCYDQFDAW